jgi:hypothetical protein
MAYDSNFPPDHQALIAAPFRDQFNGLKAIIDAQQNQLVALQQQLAPLVPVLNRSAAGQWTLSYAGPAHDYWQVWARSSGNADWTDTGEMGTSDFPATDSDMAPDGVSWWQVKICGEDSDGNPATPFSNIISFGPVPLLA